MTARIIVQSLTIELFFHWSAPLLVCSPQLCLCLCPESSVAFAGCCLLGGWRGVLQSDSSLVKMLKKKKETLVGPPPPTPLLYLRVS